jgi:hypothetical protein
MGTSAHPYFYTPIPVCKGPPLHYAVLVFALLPSLGKFPRLESFCEACADGDIYTPLYLHTLISTHPYTDTYAHRNLHKTRY